MREGRAINDFESDDVFSHAARKLENSSAMLNLWSDSINTQKNRN